MLTMYLYYFTCMYVIVASPYLWDRGITEMIAWILPGLLYYCLLGIDMIMPLQSADLYHRHGRFILGVIL